MSKGMQSHNNDNSTSVHGMLSSLKEFITNLNEKNKKIDDTLKTTKAIEKKLHDLTQFNENGESSKGHYGNSEYNKIIERLRAENATIRELKQERGDLKLLLQDYHNTLEVVMKKHRQMVSQMSALPDMGEIIKKSECKLNDYCLKVHGDMIFSAVAHEVLHDLDEYEDANRAKDERLAKLEYENKILRDLVLNSIKCQKLTQK